MQINHTIDKFFFEIFPETLNGDEALIVNVLKDFYSKGIYKPEVKIENNTAIVSFNIEKIKSETEDYNKVISFCEKGDFQSAKPILQSLIEKNPTQSEYHRIMGQILSEQGDQDEAIDCLIDALRWDAKNNYALIIVGNIFAKYKNDVDTALKYYNHSLEINPNDFISLNNIGVQLLQAGKLKEAEDFLLKGLQINNEYPNLHYAMAMIAKAKHDDASTFYSLGQVMKYSKPKEELYQRALKERITTAKEYIQSNEGKKIYRALRVKLEHESGKQIDIVEDETISTAAKIEFAENYDRENHIVKFNPKYIAYEHLVMHELLHLQYVLDARKEDANLLFVANSSHKTTFINQFNEDLKKITSRLDDTKRNAYNTELFDGMNRQIYNTPIDLFIEDHLYQTYPEIRPYQFLSLYQIVHEGLYAVTDPQIVEFSPKTILSKCKIYNLLNAMQLKDLYGVDLLVEYKATPIEMKQATKFYEEYKEYEQDKEAGEEYELIQNWAEDLKLDECFELVNESQYRKRTNIDELLTSIENDPYGLNERDYTKERQTKKFHEAHGGEDVNMAVVLYMIEAIQYFKDIPKEQIKKIAYDIAMLGTQGFFPDKQGYVVASIPDKSFSGYHILAYYYVSWAMAIPEMLKELQLPFDKEYEMAKMMK
jgi:Tfp pilus assembly protein PilF